MNISDVGTLLNAGIPLVFIRTDDPLRTEIAVTSQIESVGKKSFRWAEPNGNPLAPINDLLQADETKVSCLILRNFHWFLDKPQMIQTIENALEKLRAEGKHIIIISTIQKIPTELSREFICLEDEIPGRDKIIKSIRFIEKEADLPVLHGQALEAVVDACRGMTIGEIEDSLALSVAKTDHIDSSVVYDYKVQVMERDGFLEILRPSCTLDDVKGYEVVKDLAMSLVHNHRSKGLLLIGPGGTGKTRFMEALCGTTGIPGIKVNTGKLMSKYQGESDQNTLQLIKRIKAFGRSIVLFDEFEKQFASAGGNAETDGGTGKRTSSHWLDFLQNRPEGIFCLGSANTFEGIPPEYLRPGRWSSAPIFIGLPSAGDKLEIWDYYITKHDLREEPLPDSETKQWTGAEIETCCHLASIRGKGLKDAKRFIIPLAQTMSQQIEELISWAKSTCIWASKDLLTENKASSITKRQGRRISR